MAHQNDDEMLRSFLGCFPTYQLHRKPQSDFDLWVFSSKDDEGGSQNNSYSFSDDVGTRMRILSAFSKAWTDALDGIFQFWAPVTIDGRLVLSTYRQPFAVGFPYENFRKYRGRCVECGYNLNNSNSVIDDMIEQDEDQRPKIISNGPPLSAFFSRLPEMLMLDQSVHHEAGPLLGYGYEECRLKASWMMPIFDPSRSSSASPDCIGVVEYSSPWRYDLTLFNRMKEALENVGLRVFNAQDRIPYKTISGLKHTKEQIEEALYTIYESHKIYLAQVWISYEDDNHEHFSSSLMGTQMKQRLALKLTGYVSSEEQLFDIDWLSDYYDACDMIPLKKGDELVLKTFQDYEPRFYKDNSKLGTDILLAGCGDDDTKCSGLTIRMRSIDTSDFDYAFEFLWYHDSNYVVFLEALLLTLKRCLPRFKCASGAELGDLLRVIDVDNSTKSEIKSFKIFQPKSLSLTPESLKEGKEKLVVDYKTPSKAKRNTTEIQLSQEDIEQQYGKTMKEAAKTLGVSLSTLKRKCNGFGLLGWQGPESPKKKKQGHTNEKDNGAIQDPLPVRGNENTMTIKAEYADDIIKLRLRVSEAKFVTVENEISMKLKLPVGTYKIKYLDEDEEWILMTSDQDMSDCIRSSRNVDRSAVRLRVLLHNQ